MSFNIIMNFSLSNKNDLNFTCFNQSNDCVIFGTSIGFYVYTLNPFKKIIARKIPGGVSIVKMLYKSNIVIFVGNVDKGLYPNKKIIIWDDFKRIVIGEIIFKKKILNLQITKEIIIVVTINKIYVYNFKDLSLIKSIETCDNPKGLCSISEQSFIAYPSDKIGSIMISKYDSDFLKVISAHQNKIEIFNLSKDGNFLVSCSEKGTLIRLFDIQNNKEIKELRRGSDQAQIVDLKLSLDNNVLLCSSSKGTTHLFSLNVNDNKNTGISLWGLDSVKSYLPEYFSSEWSFSQIKINNTLLYSTFLDTYSDIISIGDNGTFYKLSLKDNKLTIEKNYKFISDEDDPFNNRNITIK